MNVNDKLLNGAGLAEVWSIIDGKYGAMTKHCWQRRTHTEDWIPQVTYDGIEMIGRTDIPNTTVYWSDSYSVNEDGLFVLNNYQTFISNYATSPDLFVGKYFSLASHTRLSVIWYAPDTATTENGYNGGINYTNLKGLTKYSNPAWRAIVGEWEFVFADSIDAYPTSGVVDGVEYLYLGVPMDNALNPTRIQTGSYTGTGGYGSSTRNTLTFNFTPKLVIITPIVPTSNLGNSFHSAVWIYGASVGQCRNDVCHLTWSGNQLTWYNQSTGAGYQLNEGREYKWVAIG